MVKYDDGKYKFDNLKKSWREINGKYPNSKPIFSSKVENVTTKELKNILLDMSGDTTRIILNATVYDVKLCHEKLAAGVYKIWLETVK
jgi:hypothetical protein